MDGYLFKAKRVDNGEWVQGYYVKGLDMYGKEVHLIFEPNTMFYSSGETDGWYKVDPTTICQCTGLKDKNGKLIWENDIVKINNSKVNMQGTSNCLTSVQKDNLLLENVKIRQATKGGSIECEIGGCFDASYPNSKTRRGRVQDKGNTCPTLTAQNQEVVRIEKVGQISSNGSQCGTVVSDNGISANLVAGTHGYANSHITTQYRIRKLTPRECGRLMGVSDEDIDKMAAVNSNTQLYKQFGNSIVVDVMCAMFKNLNIK